jgi:hypothetical protein
MYIRERHRRGSRNVSEMYSVTILVEMVFARQYSKYVYHSPSFSSCKLSKGVVSSFLRLAFAASEEDMFGGLSDQTAVANLKNGRTVSG